MVIIRVGRVSAVVRFGSGMMGMLVVVFVMVVEAHVMLPVLMEQRCL